MVVDTAPALTDEEKREREVRDKALDFQIEKTYASITETAKSNNVTLVSYISLMILGTILVFGSGIGVEEKVTVPLLQVTLNKHFAALAVIFLSSVLLWWFYSLLFRGELLEAKFRLLAYERYGLNLQTFWNLEYPAATNIIGHFLNGGLLAVSTACVIFLFLCLNYVAPPVLVWMLCKDANFPNSTTVILACVAGFSTLPALTALVMALKDESKAVEVEDEFSRIIFHKKVVHRK